MKYNGIELCVSTVKRIILTVNLCVEREKSRQQKCRMSVCQNRPNAIQTDGK